MPSERPRDPPPTEAGPAETPTTSPTPAKPVTPKPATPPPRQPAPTEPVRTAPPSPPPSAGVPDAAKPAEPIEGSGSLIPEYVDPPQPDGDEVGPAPAPPPGEDEAKPSGAGLAPPMGAGMLPGEEPEPPMLRFPPPRRPPWSGVGLFVGAGVTFSAALTEQIIAHVLVKRRCIDPFAQQAIESSNGDGEAQAEDFGEALLKCAPGILPAFALRVHSDLGLLATIGLSAAGSALRAQRDAYDDAFGDRPARTKFALQASGVGLIGLGVVTWLTTGAISWGILANCRTARCATRARLTAFTTRDTGAVMIAAGSGMLAYAMAHRRAYDRFFRDKAMSVGMSLLPGGSGLTLSGRF